MSRARPAHAPAAALAASAVLAAGLSGCISLLPKQTPAQLFRFEAQAGSEDAASSADGGAARTPVVLPPVTVTAAASGDQLLTVTGRQAAFIGGARWISPAAVLWDETVRRAFAARAGRLRLLTRNELSGGQAFLRLDVPRFEARYPEPEAAPTVRVSLHALFLHRNGAFSAERTFTADAPAAENRVGAIVSAYDAAVEQVTAGAIAWADAHAEEAAAAVEPAAPASAGPARRTTTTTTSSSTVTSARP